MARRRHARTPAAISRRIEQYRLRHRALNLQGSVRRYLVFIRDHHLGDMHPAEAARFQQIIHRYLNVITLIIRDRNYGNLNSFSANWDSFRRRNP
nr:13121_t:CDS:2 [Entrophospora candida]CAG8540127.1 12061_t:CDS:2 [Entrophospora candida]